MTRNSDTWCKHRTPFDDKHKVCEIGVDFHQFEGPGMFRLMPCLGASAEAIARCPQYCAHTAEEIAEHEREMNERFNRMGQMRKAIVEYINSTGERVGAIPCPACGTGTVRYSQASYNKHIHAGCSTPDCGAWME